MKRVLVTSALPYINGVKHLGTLVGSLLSADVFARFARARGYETLALCATDEHGSTTELAAAEAGMDVRAFCDQQYALQKKAGEGFNLAWDHFGRSSNKPNHDLTQELARALWKNGHLEVRETKQVYSHADKRFLADRYVIGTCPFCGYEAARGDQCENCTRVLDPIDLIKPRSAISGSTDIENRDSAHLFLKQSEFVPQLREWIGSHEKDWPPLVTSIANKWLDEGLRDRGITRDAEWGVAVPEDIGDGKLKGKVFYVWFDAPIEYIGVTKEWAEANNKDGAWLDWWYGEKAKDVAYYQFMGKDNVPFHTVGFPVTLMGADPKWHLVDRIKGFNWLNYDDGKFSTSQHRGVFMDSALEILPADYWRYYLMANAPESSDTNFTWEHFQSVVNKDLADVLGNFVSRVTKFCVARFDGKVPGEGEYGDEERALIAELETRVKQCAEHFEAIDFRKALGELRAIWVAGNEYITRAAPWTHIKTDRAKAAAGVRMGLNLVHLFGHLAWPVIPTSAHAIYGSIQSAPDILPWPEGPMRELLDQLEAGQTVTPPDVLFAKITDEQVTEWKARFGGLVVTLSIRQLTDADYDALREVRLEGLRLHPETFSAELEVEEAMPREQWLSRLTSAVTLGGFIDGKLAGMVVLAKPASRKIRHTGEIYAMYVRPDARGTGLSDALIEAAIDRAVNDVEQIKLTVNAENVRAIRLYERHGFRTIGKYPNSLRVGGRTYEELIMFRTVSSSD